MTWSDPSIAKAADAAREEQKKPPADKPGELPPMVADMTAYPVVLDDDARQRINLSMNSEKMTRFAQKIASFAFHEGGFGPDTDLRSRQMLVGHALGTALALVATSTGNAKVRSEIMGEAIVLALQTAEILGDSGLDHARNFFDKRGGR